MWSILFGLFNLYLIYNYKNPSFYPKERAFFSFIFGWLVGTLPLHWLSIQLPLALYLSHPLTPLSSFGLLLNISASTAFIGIFLKLRKEGKALYYRSYKTFIGEKIPQTYEIKKVYPYRIRTPQLEEKIIKKLPPPPSQKGDLLRLLTPWMMWEPSVIRYRDIPYYHQTADPSDNTAKTNKNRYHLLDVYSPKKPKRPNKKGLPIFLYIHGGGWVMGSKNDHGLSIVWEMAKAGWLSFSINYRLSPNATFPDHIVDVKRAIAWIKKNAHRWGGDPSKLVISGGSAGGHLAALAALTPNYSPFQPGFENEDTSVDACIAYYGVFDWTDQTGSLWHNSGLTELLQQAVVKSPPQQAPHTYRIASPIYWTDKIEDPPPFLIIHGENDSMVPIEHAKQFFRRLKEKKDSTAFFIRVPSAQHAFELLPSPLSLPVIRMTSLFAEMAVEKNFAR